LHISQPGTTADLYRLQDVFLWDIRDVDGDGRAELVISPVRFPSDPRGPGWYFPKWQTALYHWDEGRLVLDQVQSCPGVLPKLVTHLKLAGKASAESGVYPVLTVVQSGRPHLVLLDSSGHIRLQDLSVQ
jgi:hypothetical protein